VKLGISIRNMGPQSTRRIISDCALRADQLGLDSLWVTEHIAIPPDDAEGSGGRYLDPLITLSYLAAITSRIKLGTGALILPYRQSLTTAKLVATLQELAEGRLLLGVGIGWMLSEFRALGLNMHKRVSDSEAVLEFLHQAFDNDVVELNDQQFLFRPRPNKPPILVGGAAPHAIERAVKYGDGWLPMQLSPEQLKPLTELYRQQAQDVGKPDPQVVAFTTLPTNDKNQCQDIIGEYRDAGATGLVHSQRYEEAEELTSAMEVISNSVET
jgi:probable F420-dependent oxidoreductase